MTDNEIIKALECHKDETNSCQECVYNEGRGCSLRLAADTLYLIRALKARVKFEIASRQFAEINNERLLQKLQQAQAEAIKEFADETERIDVSESDEYIMVKKYKFYNLVKEMVGDTE